MDQETKKEFKKLNDKFDRKFDILAGAIKENQKGIQKQGVLAEKRDEKIQQLFEAVVSHNE